jgi:hypothetical protein
MSKQPIITHAQAVRYLDTPRAFHEGDHVLLNNRVFVVSSVMFNLEPYLEWCYTLRDNNDLAHYPESKLLAITSGKLVQAKLF